MCMVRAADASLLAFVCIGQGCVELFERKPQKRVALVPAKLSGSNSCLAEHRAIDDEFVGLGGLKVGGVIEQILGIFGVS